MNDPADQATAGTISSPSDLGFAVAVVLVLTLLFLPLPAFCIDLGLAISISMSVLILMVALWIEKPLDFSAFPTILLISTMLRLSLNVATTRLVLANGAEGPTAAGHVVAGFANFVMSGDLIIGLAVFAILATVNFLVITKGASRIAEVGARFTLDAVPGKQMAIDADLSSGAIDENEARRRRRELEEESAFYGAMDGASKFVRGDAIAAIIITAVNMFGGVLVGVARHDMSFAEAIEVFSKLSVGDGLVSQIPALIVSLASGLLISKGGNRGSAEKAVVAQLGNQPRALSLAGAAVLLLALAPGLPFLVFALMSGALLFFARAIAKQRVADRAEAARSRERQSVTAAEGSASLASQLTVPEIELCLGRKLAGALLPQHAEIARRMANMRRGFARRYGFVVPEVRLADDASMPQMAYRIKFNGTAVAGGEVRLGEQLVVVGNGPRPNVPAEDTVEPAFGAAAVWISETYAGVVRRNGFTPIDTVSVILTHLREAMTQNLAGLFSYRAMRQLLERLEPEYRKLLDEIIPGQMSNAGLHAVLRLLLAERVSIRSLAQVLEAIAEIAPHARKAEQIAEHVRVRLAQQICGDIAEDGTLRIVRLGSRWDRAFQQALKRDARGEVVELDLDARSIEQFCSEASKTLQDLFEKAEPFALVVSPDARTYVHMIIDRLFPALPVLSHLEIARASRIAAIGSLS